MSIFVWIGANLKTIEKKGWSVCRKKLKADLTQKKTFFDFLYWECFSRRKIFLIILRTFFFIFWRQTSKLRRPSCDYDTPESFAWHIELQCWKILIMEILNRLYNGAFFIIFQHNTIPQIFFRFCGELKVTPSKILNFAF